MKPEFENFALRGPEFKYVTNFRENLLVLIDRYFGLGTIVIVKDLKAQGVTHCNRHFNKIIMELGGLCLKKICQTLLSKCRSYSLTRLTNCYKFNTNT